MVAQFSMINIFMICSLLLISFSLCIHFFVRKKYFSISRFRNNKNNEWLMNKNKEVFDYVLNEPFPVMMICENKEISWLNNKAREQGFSKGLCLDFEVVDCLLYTSPSPRDKRQSRMPSSA